MAHDLFSQRINVGFAINRASEIRMSELIIYLINRNISLLYFAIKTIKLTLMHFNTFAINKYLDLIKISSMERVNDFVQKLLSKLP